MKAYNSKRKPKHTTKLRYTCFFGRVTATATHSKSTVRKHYNKLCQYKWRNYDRYSRFIESSFKKEMSNENI